MSAALNLPEEEVQLGPEHRIIYDLILQVKKEAADDRKIIHDKIEAVKETLDMHIGYHKGLDSKKEQTAMNWFHDLVELLKARPWISVVIGITMVLLAVNGVLDLSGFH